MRQRIEPLDLRSAEFKSAPEFLWHRLHQSGAITTTKQPLLGRIAFTVSHEASLEMLRDTTAFAMDARRIGKKRSSGVEWWVPPMFSVLADNMLSHEDDEHRRLRQLAEKGFRKANLAILQPRIEALTEAAIGKLRVAREPDIVSDVARIIPLQVISELLGLASGDDPKRDPLYQALDRFSGASSVFGLFKSVPAFLEIRRLLRQAIARRRREPCEDLLSDLIQVQIEEDRLNDDQLLSMVFLLYVAGHETTTHLISGSVFTLMAEPEAREQLSSTITPQQMTELLRYVSPVQFTKPRFVVNDMDFHGARLRRGETISVGFGAGPHVCLGLQLALRESATVLTQLFDQFPGISIQATENGADWNSRLGFRALNSLPVRLKN